MHSTASVLQEDFVGFFPDLKQYVLPQPNDTFPIQGKQGLITEAPMYETEGASDFFSSFLNSDFPIDISFPVQTVPESSLSPAVKGYSAQQRVQPQAPLMQVAQSQTPTYYKSKNPTKYSGKRKADATSIPTTTLAPKEHKSGEQDTKKQKRRVKNREAAQLFRQRQKQHIRDLEEEVNSINNRNVDLNTQLEVLRTENAMVKEQLRYLRCFITEGLKFAFPDSKFAELDTVLGEQQP